MAVTAPTIASGSRHDAGRNARFCGVTGSASSSISASWLT